PWPRGLEQRELEGRQEEEPAGQKDQQVTGLREVKEERLVRGTVQVPDLEPAPPAGREVTVVRGERHTRHLDLPAGEDLHGCPGATGPRPRRRPRRCSPRPRRAFHPGCP